MDIQLLKLLIAQQCVFISSFYELDDKIMNCGCTDGRIIGTGRADYTQCATSYDLRVGDKCFSLIDIPGIEGDEKKYEAVISSSLDKAHAIFYVNGSGKKIEKDTLTKIKKYMHDGTSVYAVFNVHCKAKKERIPGIDPTFSEELAEAYKKQQEIIDQTRSELISFLGSNYKESIPLNGLLAFSALALTENRRTTIVNDKDKSLRRDQAKYLHEYEDHRTDNKIEYKINNMLYDSQFGHLKSIIDQKSCSFDSDIYYENIKKLRNRLREMIHTIEQLSNAEETKINGFIQTYYEFISNCETAKNDFRYTLKRIGDGVAENVFYDVRNELYYMIERKEGKMENSDVENYFESNKQMIINRIQSNVNNRLLQAVTDYKESIKDAKNRLAKDLEREQLKFQVSLSSDDLSLKNALGSTLDYNWKDFGKHLFKVGSFAVSGMAIGGPIGAIIGAVVGVLFSAWDFFTSKPKRIDNAKKKLREAIDEIVEKVSVEIANEINNLDCEQMIEADCRQLIDQAYSQIESLQKVQRLLNTVTRELKQKENKLNIKERYRYV